MSEQEITKEDVTLRINEAIASRDGNAWKVALAAIKGRKKGLTREQAKLLAVCAFSDAVPFRYVQRLIVSGYRPQKKGSLNKIYSEIVCAARTHMEDPLDQDKRTQTTERMNRLIKAVFRKGLRDKKRRFEAN